MKYKSHDKKHKGHIITTRRHRNPIQKFLLDGISNYIFFTPAVIFANTALALAAGLTSWNMENITTFALVNIFIAFVFGGIYGRFINIWRKKINYQ